VRSGIIATIVGMLGALGIFMVSRRSGRAGRIQATPADIDAMTRTLLAETSFRQESQAEMAAILWVGLNRARIRGRSITETLTPPGSPMTWNASEKYARRWAESSGWRQWSDARSFVVDVLSGKWPNQIGDRVQFLHPAGMPRCDSGGVCPSGRKCADTTAGRRCLPSWSTTANVRIIGQGRFS
jgi:hypothetical protein